MPTPNTTPPMTPQEHIKQFEEKIRYNSHDMGEMGQFIKVDYVNNIFQHSVITVLKEQEGLADDKLRVLGDCTDPNEAYSNIRNLIRVTETLVPSSILSVELGQCQALSDYKLSLQKQIADWEKLV